VEGTEKAAKAQKGCRAVRAVSGAGSDTDEFDYQIVFKCQKQATFYFLTMSSEHNS
jgi:hypothetical protein